MRLFLWFSNTVNMIIHWYDFRYLNNILPYVAPYLLPTLNSLMTCSVYGTVAVALNRYIEMTDSFKDWKMVRNGKFLCLMVVIIAAVFNASRWFELEYEMVSFSSSNNVSNLTLETINSTYVKLKVCITITSRYIDRYYCVVRNLVS